MASLLFVPRALADDTANLKKLLAIQQAKISQSEAKIAQLEAKLTQLQDELKKTTQQAREESQQASEAQKGKSFSIRFSELTQEHEGCTVESRASMYCQSATYRFCRDKGFVGGMLSEQAGDSAVVACHK